MFFRLFFSFSTDPRNSFFSQATTILSVEEAINHSKNDEVLALTLERLKKETNREVVIVLLKILFSLFRERT
jgi:hypothetical protein